MTINEELREIEERMAKSYLVGYEPQLLRIATEYRELLADARDSDLEAENQRLRKALGEILVHQQRAAWKLAELSTIVHIAREALEEQNHDT